MSKITQISTKTGDKGQTSLYSGERVSKTCSKIICLAELDLLDSLIGVSHSKFSQTSEHIEIQDSLFKIQDRLVFLKGEIATDYFKIEKYLKKNKAISPVDLDYLEKAGDKIKEALESQDYKITGWIQYGEEGELSAWLDYIRAQSRKCEIEILKQENVRPDICKYINRLSDYFYWIARFCRN